MSQGRISDNDLEIHRLSHAVYEMACRNSVWADICHILQLDPERDKQDLYPHYEKGRAQMRKDVRSVQFDKALAGSDRMLIFLGQAECDQKIQPQPQQPQAEPTTVERKVYIKDANGGH